MGQADAVLRGPVEGRVGLHHPLSYCVSVGVDELSEVHWSSPSLYIDMYAGFLWVVARGEAPLVTDTSGAS